MLPLRETSVLKTLTDGVLVAEAKVGNQAAFAELLRRHQDKIFNASFRFTGNWHDAADLTQQVFLNAFRGIKNFKGNSAFSTWLYRIAFNESVSWRRVEGRLKKVALAMNSNLV